MNQSKANDQRFWKKWKASGAVVSIDDHTYNSGCMPNTDFKYEEFEGLLGSFYLSLAPLKRSSNPDDRKDYKKAMELLNGFSERYDVQSPRYSTIYPRAEERWAKPIVDDASSMLGRVHSFWRDYGVGMEAKTKDRLDVCELAWTIMKVFDRYGVAEVEYTSHDGNMVASRITDWNREKSKKTLAEILK